MPTSRSDQKLVSTLGAVQWEQTYMEVELRVRAYDGSALTGWFSLTSTIRTEKTTEDKDILSWWAVCSRLQSSSMERGRVLLLPTPNPTASKTLN